MILDASVAVQIALQDEVGQALADRLLGEVQIASPHLIDLEVAQALRRYVQWDDMSELRARQALSDFHDFPLERYPHSFLLERVWELRHNFTAYDASYVALAEAMSAPLWTLDQRMARAADGLIEVENLSTTDLTGS